MSACGVVMRLLVCGGRTFRNMALLHFGMCEVAGIWRNQAMLDEGKPTAFLAMPGGTGTADMIARCRAAGLQGLVVE